VVRLADHNANALGVDSALFRPLTPPATANRADLWTALTLRSFVLSDQASRLLALRPGTVYPVTGNVTRQLALGGAGQIGLPGVDLLVNRAGGREIGLVDDLIVMVTAAPHENLARIAAELGAIRGGGGQIIDLHSSRVLSGPGSPSAQPAAPPPAAPAGPAPAFAAPGAPAQGAAPAPGAVVPAQAPVPGPALGPAQGPAQAPMAAVPAQAPVPVPAASGQASSYVGRPSSYLELYRRAAGVCPGLPWSVLAAIGQVESGHGRDSGPSSAGARGPMQFMPGTWQSYGRDGDGDGRADIMNPYDAVPSAAGYLCANGAGQGGERLMSAVWHYNHSADYVQRVLRLAQGYSQRYGA
jgi:soluble lytic murein transglycosylase-like protein